MEQFVFNENDVYHFSPFLNKGEAPILIKEEKNTLQAEKFKAKT